MESILKIGFVGYSSSFETSKKAIEWFDEEMSFSGTWFGADDKPEYYSGTEFSSFEELLANSDAVCFFGEKVRKKLLTDAIKAFKHIFIDDYSAVLNADIEALHSLVLEAGVTAQVSFPKIYYWGVQDLMDEYTKVRNLSFYREYPYQLQRNTVDLIPEIMAAIKLVGEDVLRGRQSFVQLLSKKTEMQTINLDFTTGASASIIGSPCGFFDRHDLRIMSEKNIGYIDLRKREWHSLKPAKIRTSNLIKGLNSLPEVGDIEQFEMQDFIDAIRDGYEPFISFKDIVNLYKCVSLLKEAE